MKQIRLYSFRCSIMHDRDSNVRLTTIGIASFSMSEAKVVDASDKF